MDVAASRTAFAKLYINNNYFGLYLMVEEIDKRFVERNGFPDKNGNLYKANISDLVYDGASKSEYLDNFEQQEKNQGDTTWNDLIKFHQDINSKNNFLANLQSNFAVDYFLKSIAVDFVVANWDSFLGHGRNFSLYHSTTNGRFYWLPWDYGFAIGDQAPFDNLLCTGFINNGSNTFWDNCMAVSSLQSQYLQYICEVNAIMTNSSLDAYINNLHTLALPALETDPNRHYPVSKFIEAIDSQTVTVMEIFSPTLGLEPREYPGLKFKIAQRHNDVATLLDSKKVSCKVSTSEPTLSTVKIYPNPASEHLLVQLGKPIRTIIKLYSLDGRLISSFDMASENMVIPLTGLFDGVYVIHVINDSVNEAIKFVKGYR